MWANIQKTNHSFVSTFTPWQSWIVSKARSTDRAKPKPWHLALMRPKRKRLRKFLATFYWYWSDEAYLYSTTGKINHIHEAYCQYYAHNTLQINMGFLNNICIILMVNLNIFLHSFMTSMPVIWDGKVELQYAAKQQVWPCMTFLTCARLGL